MPPHCEIHALARENLPNLPNLTPLDTQETARSGSRSLEINFANSHLVANCGAVVNSRAFVCRKMCYDQDNMKE